MVRTEKRELMLDTAEELFASSGFDSTSVRDICQAAGVNIAMVNYYFGSKEGLFQELVQRKAQFMRGKLEELMKQSETPPLQKVHEAIRYMVYRMVQNRSFTLSISRELSKMHQPAIRQTIMDVFMPNLHMLKVMLQEGIDRNEFRPIDIEMTLSSIIGTVWNVLSTGDLMLAGLEGKDQDTEQPDSEQVCERLTRHLQTMITHYVQLNHV